MKKVKSLFAMSLVLVLLVVSGCALGGKAKSALDPKNPVTITIWHYYNGQQQQAFNKAVAEFNSTKGKELGVVVEGSSQGGVMDLEKNVIAAADGKVGASKIPNVFAAYPDTAYAMDKKGLVVDLTPYVSKEEQALYIDSYLDEGRIAGENTLKIFPIAKSIEIFALNKTDWDKFEAATGITLAQIERASMEDIVAISKKYYEWTDKLTTVPNDGKAFFGRDAMANYFIIGAKQLGTELFEVKNDKVTLHFDKKVIRKLWDNYYVPYVNGYFSSMGRFRSDDVKIGNIISFVGSSSGATFFPKEVVECNNERYAIEMRVLQAPVFAGSERYAVQQGAGMVVTKSENAGEVEGAVEFLKWFTTESSNIDFSVTSGYLPVIKSAYDKVFLKNNATVNANANAIISTAMDTVNGGKLYTSKAFPKGTAAREILEYSLSDKAKADRAVVIERMKGGMSRNDAVSLFDTDANFEQWYTATKTSLEELVK